MKGLVGGLVLGPLTPLESSPVIVEISVNV